MAYYTSFLNSIGFKAKQKVLADATYFTTIGERKLHPQTGFADWNQDFANPVDFYLLLDGHAILPTSNENFGEVNDPKINAAVATLGKVPSTQLGSVAAKWQATRRVRGQEGLRRRVRLPDVPEVHVLAHELRRGDLPCRVRVGSELVRTQVDLSGEPGRFALRLTGS